MTNLATKQAKERDMITAAGDPTALKSTWTTADVFERDAAMHMAIAPFTHTITITPVP